MSDRSIHHDTFVIERTFPCPPSRAFRALTEPEAKAQWFLPPGDWKATNYRVDCRVGGTEHLEVHPPGSEPQVCDAMYHEVLPDQRVIFSYDMHVGAQHLSVSLTTIELTPVEGGTTLTFTEQGAFLDGDAGSARSRVEGSQQLMNNLGRALADAAVEAAH